MTRIPVLTLWRPWPELILYYGKDIENRDWDTPHRGLLLIHAGKRYDNSALGFAAEITRYTPTMLDTAAPAGAIVGVVELTDVCPGERVTTGRPNPPWCSCGPWAMRQQYHWQLANPLRFPAPIPCNGRQRLWWPTGELAEQVAEQLAKVGVS